MRARLPASLARNRLCTACFTGQYPIPLGEPEVLGKHVLEGIERSVAGAATGSLDPSADELDLALRQ